MEALTRIANKLAAERARQTTQSQTQPSIQGAPPPYTATDIDVDPCSDDDEDVEADTSLPSPLKLTINAAHSIRGSHNLVPTTASPLTDVTKFSALLLHSINQINAAAVTTGSERRRLRVDLTINCGITVIGDRNVIGAVGLRPKLEADGKAGNGVVSKNAVVGAKRKAEEVSLTR